MFSEPATSKTPSYRSPWPGARAHLSRRAAISGRQKYKELQQRIKAFRTEMRDLRRSRDRWRAKAEALETANRRTAVPRCNGSPSSPPRAEPAVVAWP